MHHCKKFLLHILCYMTSYLLTILTFAIGIFELSFKEEKNKKKIILTCLIYEILLLEIFNIIGIQYFNIFGLKKMITQYKLICYLDDIDKNLKNSFKNMKGADRTFSEEIVNRYAGVKSFLKNIEEMESENVQNNEDIHNRNNFNSKKKRKRRNRSSS